MPRLLTGLQRHARVLRRLRLDLTERQARAGLHLGARPHDPARHYLVLALRGQPDGCRGFCAGVSGVGWLRGGGAGQWLGGAEV